MPVLSAIFSAIQLITGVVSEVHAIQAANPQLPGAAKSQSVLDKVTPIANVIGAEQDHIQSIINGVAGMIKNGVSLFALPGLIMSIINEIHTVQAALPGAPGAEKSASVIATVGPLAATIGAESGNIQSLINGFVGIFKTVGTLGKSATATAQQNGGQVPVAVLDHPTTDPQAAAASGMVTSAAVGDPSGQDSITNA